MSLPILVVPLGGALLLVVAAVVARPNRGDLTVASVERRGVRVMWAAAALVAVAASWFVSTGLDLGRGVMLVPAVAGVCVVAGVGLAETVVRPVRPPGPRTASLAPRRVLNYVPQRLAAVVAGTVAVHLATLVLTTLSASADDMGRAGRQIAARCGNMSSTAGPYPGSFYSVPLVLLLLLIGLAAAAALTAVVRRPRGLAPDDVGDDVLRFRSTTRILAAAGAAVAASHAGIAFFAGTALLRMSCQASWMDPAGWVLVASTPVAVMLLGWFLARMFQPGTLRVPSGDYPVVAR